MPSRLVMKKFARGQLHSGSKRGPVVRNPKQAAAIRFSEQREEAANGGRYPDRENPREERAERKPKKKRPSIGGAIGRMMGGMMGRAY